MVPKNPAVQTNNVDMDSQPGCLGNTTTSTATQLYVGPVRKTRSSSHFVGGGGKDDRTKVGGPAITVPVHASECI